MMHTSKAHPKRGNIRNFFNAGIVFTGMILGLSGCGVKGDPEPPLETPKIGRGSANFVPVMAETQIADPSEMEKDPEREAEKK